MSPFVVTEETPLAIAVQKKNNWLITKLREAEVERFGSTRSSPNTSCPKRLLNCCSGLKVNIIVNTLMNTGGLKAGLKC